MYVIVNTNEIDDLRSVVNEREVVEYLQHLQDEGEDLDNIEVYRYTAHYTGYGFLEIFL